MDELGSPMKAVEQIAVSNPSSATKRVVQIKPSNYSVDNKEQMNQHLTRVMKLIEQREQVQNGPKPLTPDEYGKKVNGTEKDDKSRGHSTVMNENVQERKSMKRSITSLSCEPLNELGMNPREEIEAIERGLGRLRIVKSIHTKIMHSSGQNKEDASSPRLDVDDLNLQRDILTPVGQHRDP